VSEDAQGRRGTPGLRFRLGSIPVAMPWSGLLGIGIIAWLWSDSFASGATGAGTAIVLSLVFAVLFYVTILGHELAHAWVARAAGYPVHSITLWVLGGYTSYERRTQSAAREGLIAAAGPATSVLIGLGCWALARAVAEGPVAAVAAALAWTNVLLGIYNALPGLPLDGGAVLKSIVWGITSDERRATVVAAWAGRVVAVFVFVVPLALIWRVGATPDLLTVAIAGLISAYLFVGASDALRRARLEARVPGLAVARLVRPAVTVAPDTPLSEAIRRRDAAGAHALVVTDVAGRPVGLANEVAVAAVPLERRPWVPVSSVSAALPTAAPIPVAATGSELLRLLQHAPAAQYLVADGEGRLVGVLVTADVEQALTG
jgi:Zn-dependent protease/CBS domain-containing protein